MERKEGRVIAIYGQEIAVDDRGKQFTCTLRGSLKKEVQKVKNLVTVGDIVQFEGDRNGQGVIDHIKERYSVLARTAVGGRKQQLIAANIDQVLITTSIGSPQLKPGLLDRYIIAAYQGNMQPVVVVNKIDLLPQQAQLLSQVEHIYRSLNIPFIEVSVEQNRGLDLLRAQMAGKASVFSGQSGVGKSSLINALLGLNLAIGDVPTSTRKGRHTTTTASLIPLPEGGWCIDTPGIKSFGVWELSPQDLRSYYKEIALAGQRCQFANCSHTHEPNCAVRQAVETGEIARLRYSSYLDLLEG